jgi:hypothetical protein
MKRSKIARAEAGNALFLILIAVALFAALSYAVTQSGRGSGSITRETGLIDSSSLTQFPAALRTAVTRLILTGSTVSTVTFDPTNTTSNGVFSSTGGGVVYQAPPSSGVDTTTADATHAGPYWRYKGVPTATNAGYYIKGIGSDTAGSGRDAFAFVGVNSGTCQSINRGLGLSTTAAAEGGTAFSTANPATNYATQGAPAATDEGMPGDTGGDSGGAGAGANAFSIGKGEAAANGAAQAFACMSNANATTGPYVYYHALIEQ